METYRTCPICLQIPEHEIYQCCNGHVVCSSCIAKLQNCPQCRIPFGPTKIRSRALEEILDEQTFNCKYKENGCLQSFKRSEVSKHANSCSHCPEYFPVCKIIGFKNCTLSVGSRSRKDIIEHFKNVHGAKFSTNAAFVNCLSDFHSVQSLKIPKSWRPVLQSCGNTENSPLFLILSKVHSPLDFTSLSCIHIWGSENVPNCVEFSIDGKPGTELVPISWKVKIFTKKDSKRMLETSPILVSIPLILEQYLDPKGDFPIKVSLSQVLLPNADSIFNNKETWIHSRPMDNHGRRTIAANKQIKVVADSANNNRVTSPGNSFRATSQFPLFETNSQVLSPSTRTQTLSMIQNPLGILGVTRPTIGERSRSVNRPASSIFAGGSSTTGNDVTSGSGLGNQIYLPEFDPVPSSRLNC